MSLIDKYGSDHQKRVAAFMKGAGQAVPDTVARPDVKTRKLRARLILEEALETIEALGFSVFCRAASYLEVQHLSFDTMPGGFDIEKVADGVADMRVVGTGTLIACGLPDTPFIEEVDRSNLAKLDGGWTDDTGKFRKPANWTPPDIAGVLHRIQQGEQA